MTIREFIIKNEVKAFEERLAKLKEMGAPKVMIEAQKTAIKELKKGNIDIGGAVEKLDNEVETFEVKKGRGGKQYVDFGNDTRYFPNAKYGRYIA